MEVDPRRETCIQYDVLEIFLTLESKWQPHKPLLLANDEDTKRTLRQQYDKFLSHPQILHFYFLLLMFCHLNMLCCKGLSGYTTDQSLRQLFSPFARLIKDSQTQRPKGFGFVTFESEDDAQKAMKALDGKIVDGRLIFVEAAKEEPPTTDVSTVTKLEENTQGHYKTS
ncbi:hypothetical protein YC2023_014799 [Brassica napus]